jgi:hypothetical protein
MMRTHRLEITFVNVKSDPPSWNQHAVVSPHTWKPYGLSGVNAAIWCVIGIIAAHLVKHGAGKQSLQSRWHPIKWILVLVVDCGFVATKIPGQIFDGKHKADGAHNSSVPTKRSFARSLLGNWPEVLGVSKRNDRYDRWRQAADKPVFIVQFPHLHCPCATDRQNT